MEKNRLSFTALRIQNSSFIFLPSKGQSGIYISFSMTSNAIIESVPEFAYLFKILLGDRYFLGDWNNHFG